METVLAALLWDTFLCYFSQINVFLNHLNAESIGTTVFGIFVIDKNTILTVHLCYPLQMLILNCSASVAYWRRHALALGHVPPRLPTRLIFLVTSAPHKLCGCLPRENTQAYNSAYNFVTVYCTNCTICICVPLEKRNIFSLL